MSVHMMSDLWYSRTFIFCHVFLIIFILSKGCQYLVEQIDKKYRPILGALNLLPPSPVLGS
jgi:hypothetical protein